MKTQVTERYFYDMELDDVVSETELKREYELHKDQCLDEDINSFEDFLDAWTAMGGQGYQIKYEEFVENLEEKYEDNIDEAIYILENALTFNQDRLQTVIGILKRLDEYHNDALLKIYNEYAQKHGINKCYRMIEFNDMFKHYSPLELAELASNSIDFCADDSYFIFDTENKELESANYISYFMDDNDMQELAVFVLKSGYGILKLCNNDGN